MPRPQPARIPLKRNGIVQPNAYHIVDKSPSEPCIHLGDQSGNKADCLPCQQKTGGKVQLKLSKCSLHGECWPGSQADPFKDPGPNIRWCAKCEDYTAPNPDDIPELPPINVGWKNLPNVIDIHRRLLDKAVTESKQLEYPSDKFHGRGIVIPAGGTCHTYGHPVQYFWCAYAAAWVLRRKGCLLPIQFWFLKDELTSEIESLSKVVGAECIDAYKAGIEQQMQVVSGWQLKIYAILNCPFQEVLFMDADNIVTHDPTYLFWEPGYDAHGALFWGDNPLHWSGRFTKDIANRLGLPSVDGELDFDTGQMIIDKQRCWSALHVVKHLADNANYWGGRNNHHAKQEVVWYGDKSDFHAGFRKSGKDYHIYAPSNWQNGGWNKGGFYNHRDAADRLIFQHCAHRKGHLANGHAIDNLDGNNLVHEAWSFRGRVPWADGSPEETDRLVNPARYWNLGRGHVSDESVWRTVNIVNEYRLPDSFKTDDLVVDIGGNVGALSYAVLRRGVGKVIVVEPYHESFERLIKNLLPFGNRVKAIEVAAWRSDIPAGNVDLLADYEWGPNHTGGYSALLPMGPVGSQSFVASVPTMPFDDIIGDNQIRLLKLDCEGSEYPILYSSKRLDQIQEIVGEYHPGDITQAGPEPANGWPEWSSDGIKSFLEANGFEVEIVAAADCPLGHFFAKRRS